MNTGHHARHARKAVRELGEKAMKAAEDVDDDDMEGWGKIRDHLGTARDLVDHHIRGSAIQNYADAAYDETGRDRDQVGRI